MIALYIAFRDGQKVMIKSLVINPDPSPTTLTDSPMPACTALPDALRIRGSLTGLVAMHSIAPFSQNVLTGYTEDRWLTLDWDV